jgi:hypothetical protein
LKFLKKLKDLIYINESNKDNKYVYRFDDKKIENFNLNLNTYQHTDDWTESGILQDNTKPKEGFKTSTGLFSGNLFDIAPYASPRGTPFLKYNHNKKDYIIFRKKDKSKIESHQPFLTAFNKKNFQKLETSNEYFAYKNNNKIEFEKQKKIINPIEFMKNQGYIIKFVDDLKTEKDRLEESGINVEEEEP